MPGGRDFTLEVCCDASAPATVRHALADSGDIGWILGDVMLVASELVTNAVRHSGARDGDVLKIEVHFGPDRVRLAVCDPGASQTLARPGPGGMPFGGLGLRLVSELAEHWGAERRPSGRQLVWAEIATPGPGDPAAGAG